MWRKRWGCQMILQEQICGLIFLILYLWVLSPLKMVVERFFDRYFGLYLSEAMSAAVYYLILTCLTVILFHRFLECGWLLLAEYLPENLLAFLTGIGSVIVLHIVVSLLPCPVRNPTPDIWAEQFAYSPAATVVVVVFLMPFVEEVLFRGLIFGSVRPYSCMMAWVTSGGFFLLYSSWIIAMIYGEFRYLLLSIYYIPMTVALTWCYERGGSILPVIVLRMLINGFALCDAIF